MCNSILRIVLWAVALATVQTSFAQDIPMPPDSITFKNEGTNSLIIQSEKGKEIRITQSYGREFSPRRASLYSAVLPGLGQAYNKKYWKMPLVYGGFVGFGMGIDFYQQRNREFRQALFAEIDGNPGTVNPTRFSESQLRTLVDRTQRERDFLVMLSGLFYMLQIVDAHIDAHLKEFKLNPDLRARIHMEPMNQPMRFGTTPLGMQTGITLKISF
jgi:hypothetical protein